MTNNFSENFVIYKARNNNDGAASQWNLSSSKDSVFLEMSNQKGFDDNKNPKFDWGNKIRFKLGVSDIGEILSVLRGSQRAVGPFDSAKQKHKGLFHSNQHGNSILYLGLDGNNNYKIYLSAKIGDDKTTVQHTISRGEASILETLLCQAVLAIYRWH